MRPAYYIHCVGWSVYCAVVCGRRLGYDLSVSWRLTAGGRYGSVCMLILTTPHRTDETSLVLHCFVHPTPRSAAAAADDPILTAPPTSSPAYHLHPITATHRSTRPSPPFHDTRSLICYLFIYYYKSWYNKVVKKVKTTLRTIRQPSHLQDTIIR